jgi:hypothetical protein
MSDAELSVTLKNATFAVKDGKMVFDKIDAITRIGGTYMKDGSVKEFTDLENPEGITSEGLTEALNEVALPSDNASNENPAGNASNKNPAGNASNENPKPADAVNLDNLTVEEAKNLTEEQVGRISLEQAQKYSSNVAHALLVDNNNYKMNVINEAVLNELTRISSNNSSNEGGSKRSRKAKRTKKGGKKRRNTLRRHRKSR